MLKKLLIALILTFIILFSFSYTFLFYCFNIASPDNLFNQKYRRQVIKYSVLREFLRLNQPGDARFDLLNSQKINLVVYYQTSNRLLPEAMKQVVDELDQVLSTDKIIFDERPLDININPVVSDQDLKNLLKAKPVDWSFVDGTVTIQTFVLKEYAEVNTYVGLVMDANNIFIFEDAIDNFSSQEGDRYKIEVSTILHEFAHLLGADHVNYDNCILNEGVENMKSGIPQAIRTSFCQEDLDAIYKALE